MKRITAILLTAAMLTLSACNGASEGQVIDLTENSSQVLEEVDFSSESNTSLEIYANWEDDLPLKLITDAIPVWIANDKDLLSSTYYDVNSDEWYLMKYILPYSIPITHDMNAIEDFSADDITIFFIHNMQAHIDPENYYDDDLGRFVIPAEIIEAFALDYFGIESLDNSQSEYYVSDGDYYLLPPSAFGGLWPVKVKKAEVDGNIITINTDWYDDEYYTNYVKSTTYTIEDNGDTFRYLSVKTYVGEEKLNDFEEVIMNETTPAPDDTAESDSAEVPEETTVTPDETTTPEN